jgi:hypothetical protein
MFITEQDISDDKFYLSLILDQEIIVNLFTILNRLVIQGLESAF